MTVKNVLCVYACHNLIAYFSFTHVLTISVCVGLICVETRTAHQIPDEILNDVLLQKAISQVISAVVVLCEVFCFFSALLSCRHLCMLIHIFYVKNVCMVFGMFDCLYGFIKLNLSVNCPVV